MSIPTIGGAKLAPMHEPTVKQDTTFPFSGNCASIYPNMDPHVDDSPTPIRAHGNQKTGSLVSITHRVIHAKIVIDTLKIANDPNTPERNTSHSRNVVKVI